MQEIIYGFVTCSLFVVIERIASLMKGSMKKLLLQSCLKQRGGRRSPQVIQPRGGEGRLLLIRIIGSGKLSRKFLEAPK